MVIIKKMVQIPNKTTICISREIKVKIEKYGKRGDSWNDIILRLLNKGKNKND